MSSAGQILVLTIATAVFVIRLTAALYRAHEDGQIAARLAATPKTLTTEEPVTSGDIP